MRKKLNGLTLAISSFALCVAVGLTSVVNAGNHTTKKEEKKELSVVDKGKKIAENRKKGNCLACHTMGDGKLPGNIGPPLIAMKTRFPDKAKLREQIADARIKNPNTIMIPFGAHKVLTDDEIDKVTEYVYGL